MKQVIIGFKRGFEKENKEKVITSNNIYKYVPNIKRSEQFDL